jgi:hypothetical protein
MAKALIGFMSSGPQITAQLVEDNRRLRERLSDLEALILRLEEENEALRAAPDTLLLALDASPQPEMQPV